MEKTVHQNLHVFKQFTDSLSLKLVSQLLLSVSVFTLFFSHSTFLSFLHSLNFCFSTFPYKLFTHTIDKNCIFLVCNGLLVFLAKYSSLVGLVSLSGDQGESHSNDIVDGFRSDQSMSPKKELKFSEKEANVPESIGSAENVALEEGNEEECYFTNQGETEVETEKAIIGSKEREQRSGIMDSKEGETPLVNVAEKGEEDNCSTDRFLADQGLEEEEDEDDDDQEDEVENGMLSTEELNKKFDEFIRRMKD
ncbi:hypothetical protein L484_018234 [Morus notabilis]|uniref:Uncharacterized protein n=2 Tax=Morus notabilis TaxID=981085 RepID=W9QFU2_9ROSA|nr:hypothetical protein L484_018234 [Morus notabilis]